MSADWRDMTIVVGGVAGTVNEHVVQLRAEGVDEGAAAYAISVAMNRALEGEVPGPACVPMDRYREQAATIGHERSLSTHKPCLHGSPK